MTCCPRANGTSEDSTARPRFAIAALNSSVSSGENVCRKRIVAGAGSEPHATRTIEIAIAAPRERVQRAIGVRAARSMFLELAIDLRTVAIAMGCTPRRYPMRVINAVR